MSWVRSLLAQNLGALPDAAEVAPPTVVPRPRSRFESEGPVMSGAAADDRQAVTAGVGARLASPARSPQEPNIPDGAATRRTARPQEPSHPDGAATHGSPLPPTRPADRTRRQPELTPQVVGATQGSPALSPSPNHARPRTGAVGAADAPATRRAAPPQEPSIPGVAPTPRATQGSPLHKPADSPNPLPAGVGARLASPALASPLASPFALPARSVAPPEPVIHVTIGRLEVRAERPAAAPRPARAATSAAATDLDTYLRQRARGEAR